MKNMWKLMLAGTAAMVIASVASAQSTQPETKPTAPAAQPEPAKDAGKKKDDVTKSKGDKDGKKDGEKGAKGDKVTAGSQAPDFKLKGVDGKEVSLSALNKEGKIVVIQWFNPDCPFVKKHYEKGANTFNDMYTKYSDKNVVIVGINSGAEGKQGAGKERNEKAVKDWKIQYPILLDMDGKVGKAYGAKATPEMFIVTPDGKIAYHGAICDDKSMTVGKTNYVAKALDEILAKSNVTTATTEPYGCSVKY
jgi:peroxiredoxin